MAPAKLKNKVQKKSATFIILGASGDLAKRKLIPAIYQLIENKKIKHCEIIACARRKLSINSIFNEAKKFIKKPKAKVWNKLIKNSRYLQIDFTESEDYEQLQEAVEEIEKKQRQESQRIFYLATYPEHYKIITKNLSKRKLASKKMKERVKVIYEKPFGTNQESAKKINKCIKKAFSEEQIYRIDHYLGKELVGNIALARFTNRILEPLWCAKHIESVNIVMNEKLGIEKRARFFDSHGQIKDVMQNHMLQLLTLVAMEQPKQLVGDDIRDSKVAVLKKNQNLITVACPIQRV